MEGPRRPDRVGTEKRGLRGRPGLAQIHEQLLLRGFDKLSEEARARNASRQELKRLAAARAIMSAYEDDISYLPGSAWRGCRICARKRTMRAGSARTASST